MFNHHPCVVSTETWVFLRNSPPHWCKNWRITAWIPPSSWKTIKLTALSELTLPGQIDLWWSFIDIYLRVCIYFVTYIVYCHIHCTLSHTLSHTLYNVAYSHLNAHLFINTSHCHYHVMTNFRYRQQKLLNIILAGLSRYFSFAFIFFHGENKTM